MSLYPTKTRLALLKAVHRGSGRIYYERAAKAAYDAMSGRKVTAALAEQVEAGWLRVKTDADEWRQGEVIREGRVYYRLTELGESMLKGAGK